MIPPAAQRGVGAGYGSGRRRVLHECLEPAARDPGIGLIVGQPEARAASIAQLYMSVIRRRPLNLRQKVRVESQLQHMLGMGTPLQLSIGHFIAEGTELRRALRSEEHTSELQSLMRTSYAVFCLK